jgi:hypothetical protein
VSHQLTANIRDQLFREEVLIAGLVRDGARSFPKHFQVLRQAASLFGRVHGLVVESDSRDGTVGMLDRMKQTVPDFRFVTLGTLREAHPIRCDRLALCRNTYLDELRTNPLYQQVRYVIVSDMDGVSRHLTEKALLSCWERSDPWDACCANQGDYYYDVWTLRHATWCPGDTWREYRTLIPLVGKQAANEVALFSRMVHLSPKRPMIEVESAFGGLAVYKREAILAGVYGGLDGRGEEICEHVTLCQTMRAKGYRVFINPALINARSTDHASRKKFFRTFRRNLWGYLSGQT